MALNLQTKSIWKRAKGTALKEDQLRFIRLSQKDHFDFQMFSDSPKNEPMFEIVLIVWITITTMMNVISMVKF